MALLVHPSWDMKKSSVSKLGILFVLAHFLASAALAEDSGIKAVASRAFAADYRAECGPKGERKTSVLGTDGVTITAATLSSILDTVHPDKPFVSAELASNGDLVMKLKGWRRWEKRIPSGQPIHARLLFGEEYTL